jgi:hypothetical protein
MLRLNKPELGQTELNILRCMALLTRKSWQEEARSSVVALVYLALWRNPQEIIYDHRQSQICISPQERIARFRDERHDVMLGQGIDKRKYSERCKNLFYNVERPQSGSDGLSISLYLFDSMKRLTWLFEGN